MSRAGTRIVNAWALLVTVQWLITVAYMPKIDRRWS
jgi:hypothetical protein